jgi:hypothetical protein
MSGALSDERPGLSFTMYNVQYVYILHVILPYSFTNLIYPNLPHTHFLSLSLSFLMGSGAMIYAPSSVKIGSSNKR